MTENRKNLAKITVIASLSSLVIVLLSNFVNIPFYYLILLVLFFLVLFKKIEYGIYLMAFFLPVINWNFSYSFMNIPFIDLLSLGVFIIYFLQVFLVRGFNKIKFPHYLSFFSFFAVVILSSLFSDNIFSSLWYSFRWILFFYLVYIVLPFNVIKNEKILKNTLLAFVLSTLAISLMGLISVFSQDWVSSLARVRPLSIFGIFLVGENQNLMVETMLPGIFILIALKYWYRDRQIKKIINLLIIFVSFILILTFSRGAWLSLFLLSIFYAVVYFRKNIVSFLMPMFLVFIVLLPVIFYMINLQTTYSVGISSNQSRILLSEIALDAFERHPILGQGTGTYFNMVAENIRFRANYYDPVDSHGVLQKVLSENGLLGIITLSIFVLAIFKKYFSILKERKYIDLYLAMIASASTLFIFELFNTSYYKGKIWFVVALSLVTISLIREEKIYEK